MSHIGYYCRAHSLLTHPQISLSTRHASRLPTFPSNTSLHSLLFLPHFASINWPIPRLPASGWNTKLSARDTNYGARIDYILCTRGLLPWIKEADIEPSIRGSDHCPIWVELHDEIEVNLIDARTESGGANEAENGDGVRNGMGKKKGVLKLKDEMLRGRSAGEATSARIAAKFWDEYSGKQTLLSSFFGKKGAGTTAGLATNMTAVRDENNMDDGVGAELASSSASFSSTSTVLASQSRPQLPSKSQNGVSSSQTLSTPKVLKRKSISDWDAHALPPTYEQSMSSLRASPPPASQASSRSSVASSSATAANARKLNPATTNTPEMPKKKAKTGKAPTKGKSSPASTGSSQFQSKLSSFFGASSQPSTSTSVGNGKNPTGSVSRSNPKAGRRDVAAEAEIEDEVYEVSDSEPDLNEHDIILVSPRARPRREPDEEGEDDDSERERLRKQEEEDYAYALALSKLGDESPSTSGASRPSSSTPAKDSKGKGKWGTILGAPLNPPRCIVHGEVTKQWTVNKAGPNKGKVFFLCSRCVQSHIVCSGSIH